MEYQTRRPDTWPTTTVESRDQQTKGSALGKQTQLKAGINRQEVRNLGKQLQLKTVINREERSDTMVNHYS